MKERKNKNTKERTEKETKTMKERKEFFVFVLLIFMVCVYNYIQMKYSKRRVRVQGTMLLFLKVRVVHSLFLFSFYAI